MRQLITDYISSQYNTDAEFPWNDSNAVFRHTDNNKWFALIMDVRRDRLGLEGTGVVSAINLKIDDAILRDIIFQEEGIMPAYHMNKLHWITIVLDGTVPEDHVKDLIDISFKATAKGRKVKSRLSKEWIIPSNPKYYDVIAAFEESDEISWKQGAGIITGDTVYLYVGAPVSAILYKCKVTETDIPYDYRDGKLVIKSLMKIKLLKRYERSEFTFARLKEEFGIFAVRGPRGVPFSLSEVL